MATVTRRLTRRLTARRRMREALLLIVERAGNEGCESFTRGNCVTAGRVRQLPWTADRWCDACVAREAL